MPLFRVTKKLARGLSSKPLSTPAEPTEPQHEWFADLFYVEGKKCVIWVHRPTLLIFVRPSVVASELREFHGLFRYEFRTAMAAMALPEVLLGRFGIYHPEAYAPTNDRGVLGSMLDYRKMFEVMVEHDGGLARAPIASINAKLNESPMSLLGMDSAAERIDRFVDAGPDVTLH